VLELIYSLLYRLYWRNAYTALIYATVLRARSRISQGHVLAQYSTILGHYSTIQGQYSTILGQYSTILGQYSKILGQYNTMLEQYSTILDSTVQYWDCSIVQYNKLQ